jgi:hypothetical protein
VDRNAHLAEENSFLETNRHHLAEFGPAQFTGSGSRGVVLIDCRIPSITRPISYLPEATMQEFSLLDAALPVGSQVRSVIERYDPAAQIIAVFLYANDASLYVLNVDDLITDV